MSETLWDLLENLVKERNALREQLRLTNIDQLQCEAERDRYKEALKKIIAFGKALQPNIHPVTFDACYIAQSALAPEEKP